MRVPRVFVPQTSPATPQGGYLQGGSSQVRSTVGESLQGIAQTLKAQQEAAQLFDVKRRLIEETTDLQTDFDARKEAAPPGAAGFADTVDEEYRQRHNALMLEYKDKGYGRQALEELDLRLGSIRSAYKGQAIAFQDQQYHIQAKANLDQSTIPLSQYAASNPNAIVSVLNEVDALVSAYRDATGNRLEAGQAQELADQYKAMMIEAAGEGLGLYHADTVINALAPEEVVTSDTVPTTSGDFNLDTYMQATRAAESTGDDSAVARTSSATGRYQFLKSTWLETYRQTYPESRETDAQILAKRKNGEVQDAVMKTFTLRNVQQLEAANVPITNASVYLAHFLGVQAAVAAFTSPASRNVSDFVSADAIAANKPVFNKVKTVGDLVEFAQSKVGNNNPGAAASTTQVVSSRVVQPHVLRDSASPPPAPSVPLIPGNLPLEITNIVKNEDGTVSTVRTISIGTDQGEVLIPTVIDGRLVSDSDAIAHYEETGEHFGVFKDAEEATAYAKWLHDRHETNLAPTGNPVLDLMTGPQRLAVLQRARSEQAKHQAENRAGVDVGLANEQAAYMTEGEYAGTPVSDEEIRAAYPPAIAEQKIKEQAEIRRIGPVVKEMKMMTPQQIAEQLELLRPKDTSSPTYATELESYNLAQRAAQHNLELRQKDPVGYTYGTFPNVVKMLQNAQSSSDRQAAYKALENAYNKLGIPARERTLFTKEQAAQVVEQYKMKSPAQKVAMVEQWTAEMPSNLMANTLSQLSKSGIIDDVNLFAALVGHPNYRSLMTNVLAGQDIINKDSARRPHPQTVNGAYRDTLGNALNALNPEASQMYKSSANALYVYMGGKPNSAEFDQTLYERALRMVIGGIDGDDSTGIINMGGGSWLNGGKVPDDTILPPGINQSQFENWIDGLAVGDLTRLSRGKKPPATATGKGVPTQDIINFGVFVMVSPGNYIIKMNNTGGTLLDTSGSPFVVHITPNTVRGRR